MARTNPEWVDVLASIKKRAEPVTVNEVESVHVHGVGADSLGVELYACLTDWFTNTYYTNRNTYAPEHHGVELWQKPRSEYEDNGVLAEKTFPNVGVVHPRATSIEQLDEVLRGLNTSEPRPIIRNGCEQAVEIIDSFLTKISYRRLGVDTPYDRLTTAVVG